MNISLLLSCWKNLFSLGCERGSSSDLSKENTTGTGFGEQNKHCPLVTTQTPAVHDPFGVFICRSAQLDAKRLVFNNITLNSMQLKFTAMQTTHRQQLPCQRAKFRRNSRPAQPPQRIFKMNIPKTLPQLINLKAKQHFITSLLLLTAFLSNSTFSVTADPSTELDVACHAPQWHGE